MFDLIDDLDMDDDMYNDNDVDREAAVDYEEEQLKGGRRYDGDDKRKRSTSEKGHMKERAFLPNHQIGGNPSEHYPSIVSFDMAKGQFWYLGQTDIEFFVEKIAN